MKEGFFALAADRQHPGLPRCLRLWWLAVLAFVSICPPTFSQHNPVLPGANDPEQAILAAKRQMLEQDEKNIVAQESIVAEYELQARKIRSQLEAFSFIPTNDISPRLKEYISGLNAELKNREQLIDAIRLGIEGNRACLADADRRLKTEEDEYKKKVTSREPRKSPGDEYRERINEQNARLRRESEQRRQDIALQNQRLIESQEYLSRPALPRIPVINVDDRLDAGELRLCEMLEQKVADKECDIAEINLLAAKGLPGTENLDIDRALKTLDLWAAWVKHETDRHLYRFHKTPEDYSNSEGYFRILMMVCTLQEDFKICYNKDPKMRAGPVEMVPTDFTFFRNPRDLFVHGLTETQHEGTCASLPVLYVAVGRRLGYPLKLVECKSHLFVRWEDSKERFNIEGTSRGLNCYPDQEYREWPWPISKEELETGMFLKSLSPRRELAAFLETRALCLKQHGLDKQFRTVKLYADYLQKKEGVNLDRLTQLMRQYAVTNAIDGSLESASLYQTLANTNSWREPGWKRDSHEKHSILFIERFDSK